MIKNKKIFLFSSLFVGCFLLGNALILSSCSKIVGETSLSSTPDNNNSNSNKPIQKPDEIVRPPAGLTPKPDVKPPVSTGAIINHNSLSIVGDKTRLLPSMMLLNEKQEIDIKKISKNYDNTVIVNETFELISLDDSTGEIAIKMNYQDSQTKQWKNFEFNFNGLMKIDSSSSFNIELKQDSNNYSNLNAYEYSNQKKFKNSEGNQKILTNFYELISNLSKENINLSLLNDYHDIPISYLSLFSVKSEGWNNNWYTSPSGLYQKYTLLEPKIKFYKKIKGQSGLILFNKEYPSNANKTISVRFGSAADYILNKVTVNNNYKETKTADFYWGDVQHNKGVDTEINLSSNLWLNNYDTSIEGDTSTKYKVVLSNNSFERVSVNDNKELLVKIKVQILTNDSSKTYSLKSKEITISNINKLDDDPFAYTKDDNVNKFYFEQDVSKLEENLKKLEDSKDKILSYVAGKSGLIDITDQLTEKTKWMLKNALPKNMKMYFNNKELMKSEINNASSAGWYYKNDDIYIQTVDYKFGVSEDYELEYVPKYFYDKTNDVFLVKIHPNIETWDSSFYTSKKPVTIHFTKKNLSLSELKKIN